MMPMTAEELLRCYGNPSLQQMARQRGLDPKLRKEGLVVALAPTLFAPARIQTAVAGLERPERTLLERIALAGGDVSTEVVRRQLEREGVIDRRDPGARWSTRDDSGTPWRRGSRKFEDLVARLGVLGLVFSSGTAYGNIVDLHQPGWRLAIHPEVLGLLPEVELAVRTIEAPAGTGPADPALLLRDAYLMISLACQAPIPLTARGQIAKRVLVQIDRSLTVQEDAGSARSEDDLARLPFLRALLEDLSLLSSSPEGLVATDMAEGFLQLPDGERQKFLFDSYRHTGRWCELSRISGLFTAGGSPHLAPQPVVRARQRVLEEIALLPAGAWIPLSHLADRMRLRCYEFLLPRFPADRYLSGYGQVVNPYLSDNHLGWTFQNVEDEGQGWEQVEGGLIATIVAKPLSWLGVVDLGLSEGAPAAFRVTAAGAKLLHGEEPHYPPAQPRVVVQPNFQLLAFPPTPEGVLFQLDRFAERVRAEQVVEYRLTRESVYRGQRNGFDALAMVRFLESVGSAQLPQNVRRTLEEWGAQHDRIRIHPSSALLQAADPAALDALYADSELSRLLERRMGPTVALVRPAGLAALHEKLLSSGRLPALDEAPPQPGRPLLVVDARGGIQMRQPVPSIHLLRALRSFAEEDPDGGLRLTPAGLRRSAEQGQDGDAILALLEQWHVGALPAEVPAMVRRWAKDWGRGSLEEVALLRVERPEVLRDLMADPEVGMLLTPVNGSATLAITRADSVQRLRSALEERGMVLDGSVADR